MTEKIIISMTSWTQRIKYVPQCVNSLLNNSMVPDKIILNLSTDEFTNRELDLPIDVLQLKNTGIFEIFWVKENNYSFKKIIPTLRRFPDDIIISVDDDIFYKPNFIESFYNAYVKNDCKYPIAFWNNTTFTNGFYGAEVKSHNGYGTLCKAEHFGKYIFELYENFGKTIIIDGKLCAVDDILYTYACLINGCKYKWIGIQKYDLIKAISTDTSVSSTGDKHMEYLHKIYREYIEKTYYKKFVKDIGLVNCFPNNEEQINIIGNNDITARLYEVSKLQFPNQFIWASIDAKNFAKLASEFELLNFNNVEFTLEDSKDGQNVIAKINDIDLHFTHYLQDSNATEVYKMYNTNIFSNNIIEYIKNKWLARSQRLQNNIAFLYSFNFLKSDSQKYKAELEVLKDIDKPLIILAHENADLGDITEYSNVKVIRCSEETMTLKGTAFAKEIKDTFFNEDMKKWINSFYK